MSTPTREKPSTLQSLRGSANLVLWVIRVWALSLEMFLHRNLGVRYMGFQAGLALLLMSLYSVFWPGYDLRAFSWFMFLYLAMWIKARFENAAARRRGEVYHSRYTGWPSVVGPKAKFSEITAKRYVEPGFILAFGLMLRELLGEQPLGTYLIMGAVCLFLSVQLGSVVEGVRQMDLSDAVIEQEFTAERFRETRGEV
jgi:hypothetical protein